MLLAWLLMMQAGATSGQDFVPLATLMSTFTDICVSTPDFASARKVADAVPGVSKEVVSGYNEKREPLVPEVRYCANGMRFGTFGSGSLANCYAASYVEPSYDLEKFQAAVAAQFGHTKFEKVTKAKGFFRGGWNEGSRYFAIEWREQDGRIQALLTVRKRDGYS